MESYENRKNSVVSPLGFFARISAWWLDLRRFAFRISFLPFFSVYFIIFAGIAAILPSLSMYLKAKGIDAHEMALLGFVTPLLAIFVKPIIAFIADKTGWHRSIASACVLLSAVFFTLMLVTPERHKAATASPSSASNLSFNVSDSNFTSNASTATPTGTIQKWGLTDIRLDATFLLLLLFRTGAWLWLNPVFNLLDALTFAVIHRVLSSSEQPSQSAKELALDTGAQVVTDPAVENQNQKVKACNDMALNDMSVAAVTEQKREGDTSEPQVVSAPESEPLNAAQRENCSNTKGAGADVGQQNARAYGLIRSGGSIGFMFAAGAIALGTLLFELFVGRKMPVLEQFVWLVGIACCCATGRCCCCCCSSSLKAYSTRRARRTTGGTSRTSRPTSS
jgi:hypothetical protein